MKEENLFYIQGLKKGAVIPKFLFIISVFMILILLVFIFFLKDDSISITDISIIILSILWVFFIPMTKIRALYLNEEKKELEKVTFFNLFKTGGIELSKIKDITIIENTSYRISIEFVDGSNKVFSIENRDLFIKRFNEIR